MSLESLFVATSLFVFGEADFAAAIAACVVGVFNGNGMNDNQWRLLITY